MSMDQQELRRRITQTHMDREKESVGKQRESF